MISGKNNLTVKEWNKFYIELIVLYVHLKIAIMLDHSRLGLENKFFPNKITKAKKKNNLARAAHFFCTVISLPLFCTTTTWNFQKLPSYTFYGGNVACGPSLFFRCRSFLPWWPLAFLIFSQPLRNVHVILQTKLVFLSFLISGSSSFSVIHANCRL